MSTFRIWLGATAPTRTGATPGAAVGSRSANADPAWSGGTTAEQAVGAIVRLAAERVMTADTVAAAKWGTSQPIDDPAREESVLRSAAAKAADLGIDQAIAQRILEDQIAANKRVQRALHTRWTDHPAEQPTRHPDLATQVRPILDRLDSQLLTAVGQAQTVLSRPDAKALMQRRKAVTARAMSLDAVHRSGLDQALAHTLPGR